jgi:hypothetical protein
MILITLLPYGVIPQSALKDVAQPSVAGVLVEHPCSSRKSRTVDG